MAEAYFNSLKLPGIKATSSGIYANSHDSGPISWYSMKIIYDKYLVKGMSRDHKITTVDILKQSEFVIFMEDMHFNHCKNVLQHVPEFYQIWDVSDLFPELMTAEDIIDVSEKTFNKIKKRTDDLVSNLSKN
jgi:hypothetical protein